MEYQKIANLLDNNLSNQPCKFRTKNWVEINNESKESYSANSDIKQQKLLELVLMLLQDEQMKEIKV